jgi:hypothetical protein
MARVFHRLTSYQPGREWTQPSDDPWLVTSFEPNDLELLPPPVKTYDAGLPVVPLPHELPAPPRGTLDVLNGGEGGGAPLDLAQLARLLHLSAGVVRTEERPGGRTIIFRAAGSAGARFPLEVYAIVPAGTPGLPAGVHAYRPLEHALLQVGPPPGEGPPGLVLTGVPWRTAWRYRERGYRHIFWDAGTVLSQQLVLAGSAGLPARLYTEFPDVELRDLVGADGIDEFPVAVVALGDAEPEWSAGSRSALGSTASAPVRFPLVTAAHWAGISRRCGPPWRWGEPVAASPPESPPVNDVIYQRGSTRLMSPDASLPREALELAVGLAVRGIRVPHFVAVHAVDGVDPGVYRWPDLAAAVRPGNLRAELRRIALGQALAGDAAFVVIGAADLRLLSDRGYREAQVAAGLVAGRLHLAAFALGYGASGMTFLDSELPGLLRRDLQGLLFTCFGVPEYANRAGGSPGEPARVRQVLPRLDD